MCNDCQIGQFSAENRCILQHLDHLSRQKNVPNSDFSLLHFESEQQICADHPKVSYIILSETHLVSSSVLCCALNGWHENVWEIPFANRQFISSPFPYI